MLAYLTAVLRGEAGRELQNASARMKAAELLAKRTGVLEEDERGAGRVVIIDDVRPDGVDACGGLPAGGGGSGVWRGKGGRGSFGVWRRRPGPADDAAARGGDVLADTDSAPAGGAVPASGGARAGAGASASGEGGSGPADGAAARGGDVPADVGGALAGDGGAGPAAGGVDACGDFPTDCAGLRGRARRYTPHGHAEYWFRGGRGSGKSSFIALEIVLGLLRETRPMPRFIARWARRCARACSSRWCGRWTRWACWGNSNAARSRRN